EARLLWEPFRLGARHMRRPRVDRVAQRRDLGAIHEIDVEAGAHDDGVEAVLALGCHDLRTGKDVIPSLAETQREARMPLAAQHTLIGRWHLLAEDVGIEAPAPRIVER